MSGFGSILSAPKNAVARVIKRFLRSRPQLQLRALGLLLFWHQARAPAFGLRMHELGRLLADDRVLEHIARQLEFFRSNGDQPALQVGLRYLEKAGHSFAAQGKQAEAERCLSTIAAYRSSNSVDGVENLRHLGIVQFMLGRIGRARAAFAQAGLAQRYQEIGTRVRADYRFLGRSWFVALGHVAMIDILLKQRELGWLGNVKRLVVGEDVRTIAGRTILGLMHGRGIEFSPSQQSYYDSHRSHNEPAWDELTDEERAGLTVEFWTYSIPGADGSFYAHGASAIQGEWERQGRAPLLALSDKERDTLRMLLEQLGIPGNAWYVCLHVRESGFHGTWNRTYPTARDANVEDYYPAMQAIVERGGWVIRMGDSSMKPLREISGVVDYAHTVHKSEPVDTLLAAGCRFMLGTNSGFSILPANFGSPCVLTNWVPIALPNWYGADLMIPKLMRSKRTGQLLDFATMLEDPLGGTQNLRDFPADIEILESTPEEIREVTIEMLDRLDGSGYSAQDDSWQKIYFDLAISKGSYKGGRIGSEFLANHRQLLPKPQ